MTPLAALLGLYRGIERVFLWLAHAALLAMMAATALDALLRYLFTYPLNGVQELADEFFMPALIYLAVAHIYGAGGHIRITGTLELLPAAAQRILLLLSDLATFLFFVAITYGVTVRAIEAREFREYSSSPLDYLIWPSFAIVAIGSALMSLRVLAAIVTARHPMAAAHDQVE